MKETLREWWQNATGYQIKLLLAGLMALVVFGGLFVYQHHAAASRDASFVVARESEERPLAPTRPNEKTTDGGQPTMPTEVVVHVTGAVKYPGVYTFDANARANDAVQKAVPAEDADINALNLAARLIDGDRIVVPRQGEAPEAAVATAAAPTGVAATGAMSGNGKVSLNRSTSMELETLPGIGPAKAQAIIAYREEHGGFKTVDELKQVSGIGEKTYEQLADAIAL